MTLQGKGMMIWKIPSCENGDANKIASEAQLAGLTHILIKIADGPYPFNVEKETGADLVPALAAALRARGIQVWGWHYVYGYNPVAEAKMAVQRVKELGLDGYVIDAEVEYKTPGRDKAASAFMTELRQGLPQKPLALSSFRFPSLHPQLPWKAFLEKCDYNMPQVYWEQAHNPGAQLQRTVREFAVLAPQRPVIPTGPIYSNAGWEPTVGDIKEFLVTARGLNLSAVNFYAYDHARAARLPLWDTVAAYPWSASSAPQDLPLRYIEALNAGDPALVTRLYTEDAVRITAAATLQGSEAIRSCYQTLLGEQLPGATFSITSKGGSENTFHFNWTASGPTGSISDGSDTIGSLDGKISYHYSSYTIDPK
jgi:hypothetical protein